MRSVRTAYSGRIALHLTTLFTISVAHPLYDLFAEADHAAFFVAHQAKSIDIWVLVLVLSLILPLGLAMIVWLTGLLSRRLGAGLYLAMIFSLAAAFLVPISVKVLPGAENAGLTLAVALSAALTLAYRRLDAIRFFFTLFSVIVIVSPALFLTSTPIRAFLLAPENQDYAILSGNSNAPDIIMLVFDELPLTSLLDETGQVDRERYPNFHRLAGDSTWYRNAAATHTITRAAAPAMLTGVLRASADKNQEASESIFTLLAPTHRIVAMEHATLYARAVSDAHAPKSALADRLAGELGDIALIYAHVVVPRRFSGALPAVDNQWSHFGAGAFAGQALDPDWPYLGHWPTKVREFVDLLERPARPPTFYFFHLLMPHQPFQYDHEGNQHGYQLPTVTRRVTGRNEIESERMAILLYQAHLLKLGFTDRLLGHIFERLDHLGLYDSSLIVVTADHGVSFYWDREGNETRLQDIQKEDVANVPLFIKAPEQAVGTISSAPVQTHDIVPTMAALLGIEVPWRMDGAPALTVPADRQRTAYLGKQMKLDPLIDPQKRSLNWKIEQFGRGVDGLYSLGPASELLGQPVDGFVTVTAAGDLQLSDVEQFQDVRPASASLPAYVEGLIRNRSDARTPPVTSLAIAVNGVIRATTRTWQEDGDLRFLCRLPPASFRPGNNEVRIYGLVPDNEGATVNLLEFTAARS